MATAFPSTSDETAAPAAISAAERHAAVVAADAGDPVDDDLTGRDRFAWNVLASWAGHFVFIVAGFIMPRQIDRHVGQVGLGVWDFGWTAVNYFSLAQIGVGVSVNRYVARYRAARDNEGLGRLISSVMLLQLVAACLVTAAAVASALWLPRLFRNDLGGEAGVAVWVIFLLGMSVAVRMVTQPFSGVVTGCHRWDLHNLLNGATYAITVVGMLFELWRGSGLIGISVVYLIGTTATEIIRVGLAFRVCPELRVSVGRARWTEARGLIAFGAKLSTPDTLNIVVGQLTNMLVLSQIGIGTLAVYSRLGALIRHSENIITKYSLPLTPTASSLQGSGQDEEVRELVINSTRFAAYLIWPILLGFAIVGHDVMQLWMGPRYDPTWVLTLMAVGSMFPISQEPIFMLLIGLNMHGRFAATRMVGSVLGFAVSLAALRWLHYDLLGLAAVGLAVSNGTALFVTIDTCRRLSIPVRRYFIRAYAGPLACAAPFGAGLIVVALAFDGRPALTLALSALLGICLLVPLYWRLVPPDTKEAILQRVTSKLAALRLAFQVS
jgi:O-antigen/teichoic acid export membrane protein